MTKLSIPLISRQNSTGARKALILFFVLVSALAYGQEMKTYTGIVTNMNQEPLPGVTVRVEGSAAGTATDSEGRYSIRAEKGRTVTFSMIGLKNQQVVLGDQEVINIQLSNEGISLEEIVVVGYGTQERKDLTGSIASANIEDLRDVPNTNIAQSLQGTVPGLNVGQVNSAGQTPPISIRGQSTISGNTNVLVILDGIQYNGSLSALNPDDIQSIDVLKDASSTAVYGAQAANGVILITSKKGRKNEAPKISFSSSYTIQEPTQNLRPMNREEYLNHIKMLFYDQAFLGPDFTQPNPDFDVADEIDASMRDADDNILPYDFSWWDAATRRGATKEVKANVTGGSERTNYLVSLGLTDQQAFIKNDDFKRKSLRVNLETEAAKWWTVGIQSFGSFVNTDGAQPDLDDIILMPPLLVPYDENGDMIPYPMNTLSVNPFISYDVDDQNRENYLFANIYSDIAFPFLKGLSYRINYGNNYKVSNHYWASQYGAGLTGSAYKHHADYYDYTFDNILTYKNTFGSHSVNATLLYGAIERRYSYTDASAEGFDRITLGYNSIQQGNIQYANSDAWNESLLYQMARINYKYKDRYLLTATVRRDGFSGFAENNKYALFPSAALAWVASEEPFFKADWVDNLKVRLGYGVSGNQTGRYKSLSTLISRPSYIFGDGGSTAFGQEVSTMANPNLRWEKTTGINAGVDFSLLNYKLEGSIDYYNSTTNDLLFDVKIPYVTGFDEISTNLGEIKNKGIELSLTSRNIDAKDFKWSSTLSFSRNTNKITKLTGQDADGDGKEDDLVTTGLFIGESLGAIYGYKTNGIYQLDDDIPTGYFPGTFRVVDVNGDGKTDPSDRVILGRSEPAFRISLWNKFNYKNFSLGVFLNSIQGGKDGYMGLNVNPLVRDGNGIRNNYLSGISFWSPLTPNGENPRFINNPQIQPAIYKDRSFVRLQDVTLSYKLDQRLLNKIKFDNLSIFLSGKNLATWTNWKGWDPETNQGMTRNGRPVLRSYSLGVNVSF